MIRSEAPLLQGSPGIAPQHEISEELRSAGDSAEPIALPRSIQLMTLRLCLVVAAEGSLIKAAERCAIHPSALSRRVRELEAALGEPIFQRRPGGTTPTVGGNRFLVRLRQALDELDRTPQALNSD